MTAADQAHREASNEALRAPVTQPPAHTTTPQASAWLIFFMGALYIVNSAALIACNKHLMSKDAFPQPLALVTLHMGSGFIFAMSLYLIRPSLFPSMNILKNETWSTCLRMFPIAVCCAVSFVLSNAAYIYVSVALLQILKEINVVLVYTLSLVVGLAVFNWRMALILFIIAAFTAGAAQGDVSFVWIGVGLQMISQLFEVGKIVLMNYYLSNSAGAAAAKKLDPLTLLLVITPFAFVMLASVQAARWDGVIISQAGGVWGLLVLNMFIAFSLNVVVTNFLRISTGISFIVAGIVKDIGIVSVSAIIFKDALMVSQIICFSISMCVIFFHAMMKVYGGYDNGYLEGSKALWADIKKHIFRIQPDPTKLTKDNLEEAGLLAQEKA